MNNDVKTSLDYVEKHFESELDMKKLREELLKCYSDYQKTISYMVADAPIEALCLPKATENILLSNGLLRVYDLFNMDFTKIKGLGSVRIRDLTSRLEQFFSML